MPRSVSIGPGTADPFSPKAVRASMGAVFEVPLARAAQLADLPGTDDRARPRPHRTNCGESHARGATNRQADCTLLVGAEREGLPPELVAAADATARIPIHTHSLNAAMAATVAPLRGN